MALFWKSKTKTPADLCRSLRESITKLDSTASAASSDSRRKANEEIAKTLASLKLVLCGDADNEAQPDQVVQLANEIYNTDTLSLLISNMVRFDFEARKDVALVFSVLLRRQTGTRFPTVEYLASKQDVVFGAVDGYRNPDLALNTGMILREMLRHEALAKILLHSERLYDFVEYIEQPTFGAACDAMLNFKEVLTRHKSLVAEFLEANYDRFFAMYHRLYHSTNYVTKRQSLKLLGEILLDRANFNVMTRYIASEDNLKDMMNILRDKSKNIQFEAFHVFKVFVANPNKPENIAKILRKNKDRLIVFLQNFHNDREDEQFTDEKAFLLVQIQEL